MLGWAATLEGARQKGSWLRRSFVTAPLPGCASACFLSSALLALRATHPSISTVSQAEFAASWQAGLVARSGFAEMTRLGKAQNVVKVKRGCFYEYCRD